MIHLLYLYLFIASMMTLNGIRVCLLVAEELKVSHIIVSVISGFMFPISIFIALANNRYISYLHKTNDELIDYAQDERQHEMCVNSCIASLYLKPFTITLTGPIKLLMRLWNSKIYVTRKRKTKELLYEKKQ